MHYMHIWCGYAFDCNKSVTNRTASTSLRKDFWIFDCNKTVTNVSAQSLQQSYK